MNLNDIEMGAVRDGVWWFYKSKAGRWRESAVGFVMFMIPVVWLLVFWLIMSQLKKRDLWAPPIYLSLSAGMSVLLAWSLWAFVRSCRRQAGRLTDWQLDSKFEICIAEIQALEASEREIFAFKTLVAHALSNRRPLVEEMLRQVVRQPRLKELTFVKDVCTHHGFDCT